MKLDPKRFIQIGFAVVGLVLVFSIILGAIGGSSRDIDDEMEFGEAQVTTTTYQTTITGPETTEVVTTTEEITTTAPPETITEPGETTPPATTTPGAKPLVYDGKLAVSGSFGLYDAGGNEVKVYPFAYIAEGKKIAYYEARVDTIEILGGSGLRPDSWVLYIRTKVSAKQDGQWVAQDVIIADDVQIYSSDMVMKGYGVDSWESWATKEWGRVDLSDHWYGGYKLDLATKKAIQYVSIGNVYSRADIPSACETHGYSVIWDPDVCDIRCPPNSYPNEDCTGCIPIETTTAPTTTAPPAPIHGQEPGPSQTTTVKFTLEIFLECHDKEGNFYSAAKEDPHTMQVDIREDAQTCGLSVIGIGAGDGIGRWFFMLLVIIGSLLIYTRRR